VEIGRGLDVSRESYDDLHIHEIQKEYTRIDNDWLTLHYKTTIGLVLFAFIIECAMGVFLMNSDMLTTTVPRFILKFIVIPSGINFIFLGLNRAAMKSRWLSQTQKIYIISLVLVVICFILFTTHSAFTATYYMFTVAIMMTTIYASYRVTGITAVLSIAAIVVSELFIKWDVDKASIFSSTLRMGDFLISLFIMLSVSVVCMVVIRFEQKKNTASIQMELERQQLQRSLQIDEATGIYNRKALHDSLKNMEDERREHTYILAIADIDNFKGINDTWGHPLGDRCLIEFARLLKENSRNAVPFRYGGDEFCLLFRNVTMDAALQICEHIRVKVSELKFENMPLLSMTVSFGLSEYSEQVDTVRLFTHSDHALYKAKEVRNAIRVFEREASLNGDR